MIVLDGLKVSNIRNQTLKEKIEKLNFKRKPCLAIILVGDNSSSKVYVENKIKKGGELGFKVDLYHFPSNAQEKIVASKIKSLNKDKNTDGIIVQLPLPKNYDANSLLDLVCDLKDVDGFSLTHQGLLFQGRSTMIPATPKGILSLLKHYEIELAGLDALVIGRSLIVGRPTAQVLMKENATVTLASKHTKDLKKHTLNADLIVSATGSAHLIKKDMVKKGVIIIDVGFSKIDGKTVGDCDFQNLKEVASFMTPVPKGVGPMTINALLENTYLAFLENNNIKEVL